MKRTPLRSSPAKLRAWRRRSVERYEDRLRQEHDCPFRRIGQNPARRAKRFRAGFGSKERAAFVQGLPCAVCGATPSENAHVKSRGAGGGPEHVAPLCRTHHREQHRVGVRTFSERHGIDLQREARRTNERWEAETEREDR